MHQARVVLGSVLAIQVRIMQFDVSSAFFRYLCPERNGIELARIRCYIVLRRESP